MKCKYVIAWQGVCKNEADESGYCKEHKIITCVVCGEKATHQCDETAQFICGAPLCDNCEHTLCENGCNSGAPSPEGLGIHCKKSDQVYKNWIISDGEGGYNEKVKARLDNNNK